MAHLVRNLYLLKPKVDILAVAAIATEPVLLSLMDLHKQLGNVAPLIVCLIVQKRLIDSIILMDDNKHYCKVCKYAKKTRALIAKMQEGPRAKKLGI